MTAHVTKTQYVYGQHSFFDYTATKAINQFHQASCIRHNTTEILKERSTISNSSILKKSTYLVLGEKIGLWFWDFHIFRSVEEGKTLRKKEGQNERGALLFSRLQLVFCRGNRKKQLGGINQIWVYCVCGGGGGTGRDVHLRAGIQNQKIINVTHFPSRLCWPSARSVQVSCHSLVMNRRSTVCDRCHSNRVYLYSRCFTGIAVCQSHFICTLFWLLSLFLKPAFHLFSTCLAGIPDHSEFWQILNRYS